MKRYMVFVRICFYVLYVLYIQNVPKYMKYMKLCSSKTTAKIMYRRKEKTWRTNNIQDMELGMIALCL